MRITTIFNKLLGLLVVVGKERIGRVQRIEQRRDPPPQRQVLAAGTVEERRPLDRSLVEGLVEQLLGAAGIDGHDVGTRCTMVARSGSTGPAPNAPADRSRIRRFRAAPPRRQPHRSALLAVSG